MKGLILIILLSLFNFCDVSKVNISKESATASRENVKKIVLEIGSRKISYGEWKRYLKENVVDEDLDDGVLSKLFDNFVEQELLYKAAIDGGYKIDVKKYEKFIKELGLEDNPISRKDFLVAFYLKENVKDKVNVSKEEMKRYYKEHFLEFRQKKLYHIKEIVVNSKELAKEIHSELVKNGVLRFGNFAREYSISPSAINGGDLGYFSKNQLPPEFEKIIFSLKPGKISKVIRTKYGYHIFYLEEVLGEHQLKFYEVKDKIKNILRERREKKLYEELLKNLREKCEIVIHKKNLGFNYRGIYNN